MDKNTSDKNFATEKKALGRISDSERQSWTSVAFIWIGTMICIPMLMVGGMFAGSMTFSNIALATAAGFIICCFVMMLTGMQGTDLGLPSTMCATRAFGDRGSSYLMSVVVFIAQIGWFGVQTATCALAFNTMLKQFGVANFPFIVSCIIWGGVMLVTAVYGFKFMKVLNYIAVPVLLGMCIYGGFYALKTGGGWGPIMDFVPETEMSVTAAISAVIGLFAVGTVINSDYSRYAKNRTATALATFVGVLPAAIFMILVGAVMARATGNSDITAIFAGLGLPVLAMLVLILATWTTNTGNAYTAGLAAMKMLSLKDEKRPLVTMICGVLGILVAVAGLANALSGFINILSSLVPPIAGVMIADYWIVCKGKAENWSPTKGINFVGLLSWACGAVVALFFSFFSPALDGIIVCCVMYVVLNALLGKTALAGQGSISVDELEENMK